MSSIIIGFILNIGIIIIRFLIPQDSFHFVKDEFIVETVDV